MVQNRSLRYFHPRPCFSLGAFLPPQLTPPHETCLPLLNSSHPAWWEAQRGGLFFPLSSDIPCFIILHISKHLSPPQPPPTPSSESRRNPSACLSGQLRPTDGLDRTLGETDRVLPPKPAPALTHCVGPVTVPSHCLLSVHPSWSTLPTENLRDTSPKSAFVSPPPGVSAWTIIRVPALLWALPNYKPTDPLVLHRAMSLLERVFSHPNSKSGLSLKDH